METPTFKSMTSLRDDYRALVIGASGGIGSALCACLRRDPRLGEAIELSRSRDGLDITSEQSVRRHADMLEGRPVDLVICTTGVLTIDGHRPEKSLKELDPALMASSFVVNAIGPALVAKHFLPRLSKGDRAVAAFLSARVGSIGDNRLGGWISYRSAKAALNQIVRTASIELARTHALASVVSLHPGTVSTQLSRPYTAGHHSSSADDAAHSMLQALDGLAPGTTGAFIAYDGTPIAW